MYEHYFNVSDQIVVFNNRLLAEKERSLLIYLDIYWMLIMLYILELVCQQLTF